MITQQEVDDDQAYWCSLIDWSFLEGVPPQEVSTESYKFIIFDLTDTKEDEVH